MNLETQDVFFGYRPCPQFAQQLAFHCMQERCCNLRFAVEPCLSCDIARSQTLTIFRQMCCEGYATSTTALTADNIPRGIDCISRGFPRSAVLFGRDVLSNPHLGNEFLQAIPNSAPVPSRTLGTRRSVAIAGGLRDLLRLQYGCLYFL